MFSEAWSSLPAPYRRCLELAWESYRSGSIGIGSVITGPDGAVVAEGRNRWFEPLGPGADIGGSKLSHAETEALALVPGGRDLDGHVVWTSLEPCVMCAGAMVIAHVPEVRFLATDHLMSGLGEPFGTNQFVTSRWPRRVGPEPGPLAAFATMIPVARFVARHDREHESVTLTSLRDANPALAEVAVDFAAEEPVGEVTDVLARWWDRLAVAAG